MIHVCFLYPFLSRHDTASLRLTFKLYSNHLSTKRSQLQGHGLVPFRASSDSQSHWATAIMEAASMELTGGCEGCWACIIAHVDFILFFFHVYLYGLFFFLPQSALGHSLPPSPFRHSTQQTPAPSHHLRPSFVRSFVKLALASYPHLVSKMKVPARKEVAMGPRNLLEEKERGKWL